jgi:chromosomal replication initiation ATPase DnaA
MKQIVINIPDGLRYATLHIRVDGEKIVLPTKEEAQANVYLDAVLRLHEIDEIILKNQDRHHRMIRARQQLCLLLRKNTKLSFDSIGKMINRDHATALWACKTAQNRIDTRDYPFFEEWRELNDRLFNKK